VKSEAKEKPKKENSFKTKKTFLGFFFLQMSSAFLLLLLSLSLSLSLVRFMSYERKILCLFKPNYVS
jgi:hypothetical protein